MTPLRYGLAAFLLVMAAGCSEQADAGVSAGCDARIRAQAGHATSEALAAASLPILTGRVVDGAALLGATAKSNITDQSSALEAATLDQLVVVTVPSLGGQTIEAFGLALGKHWGIGQRDLDNGVLLIVAPNERKVRIEVGLGLETILTDVAAKRIIEEKIVPAFSAGRYERGIIAGTSAIVAVLRTSPVRTSCPAAKVAA